jgi:hypothetical protein
MSKRLLTIGEAIREACGMVPTSEILKLGQVCGIAFARECAESVGAMLLLDAPAGFVEDKSEGERR